MDVLVLEDDTFDLVVKFWFPAVFSETVLTYEHH